MPGNPSANTSGPPKSDLELGLRGLKISDVQLETRAVTPHLAPKEVKVTPMVPPIYINSTFVMESAEHFVETEHKGGYVYQRDNNPSVEAVEVLINGMEGGAGTLVFNSGTAAVTTVFLAFLRPGDHVVCQFPVYGGTSRFLEKYLPTYNISHTFVSTEIEEYKKAIKPNTKMLFAETPSNPLVSIVDLAALAELAKQHNCLVVVDSTFATPALQQPLKFGVDIVIHSGSKFMGGHSDLIAGIVTLSNVENWNKLFEYRVDLGNYLSPFDCALLLRGMKTLPVRMDRASENAKKIAEFLQASPKVSKVCYPGLQSHPGHEVAKRQMKTFGAMLAFEVKGGSDAANNFAKRLKLIHLAPSLGGTESSIQVATLMTHGYYFLTDEQRTQSNITSGVLRYSVGLENVDDLLADLSQALEAI